jgi:hypothetical protein
VRNRQRLVVSTHSRSISVLGIKGTLGGAPPNVSNQVNLINPDMPHEACPGISARPAGHLIPSIDRGNCPCLTS